MLLNEVARPDTNVETNLAIRDLQSMLFESLQKLKQLENHVKIYPGHGSKNGEFSTIEREKNNKFGLNFNDKLHFMDRVLEAMSNSPLNYAFNHHKN